MARRTDLSWGSAVPTALLNLAAQPGGKEIVVLRDGDWGPTQEVEARTDLLSYGNRSEAEALHARFGGKCYYTSRSGLSGAGFAYLPPSVVKVGTFGVDKFYPDDYPKGLPVSPGVYVAVPIAGRVVDYDGFAVVHEIVDGEIAITIVPCSGLLAYLRGGLDTEGVEWRENCIPAMGKDLEERTFSFHFPRGEWRYAVREDRLRATVRALTYPELRFKWLRSTVDPLAVTVEYDQETNVFWRTMGVFPASDGWGYKIRGGICRGKHLLTEMLSSVEALEQAMPARGQAIMADGNTAMYVLVEDAPLKVGWGHPDFERALLGEESDEDSEERPKRPEPLVARAICLFHDGIGMQWAGEVRCTSRELLAIYAGNYEEFLERARKAAFEELPDYKVRELAGTFRQKALDAIWRHWGYKLGLDNETEITAEVAEKVTGSEELFTRAFEYRDKISVHELNEFVLGAEHEEHDPALVHLGTKLLLYAIGQELVAKAEEAYRLTKVFESLGEGPEKIPAPEPEDNSGSDFSGISPETIAQALAETEHEDPRVGIEDLVLLPQQASGLDGQIGDMVHALSKVWAHWAEDTRDQFVTAVNAATARLNEADNPSDVEGMFIDPNA